MTRDRACLNLGTKIKKLLEKKLSMHCLEVMQKKRIREKVQHSASDGCNSGRIFPRMPSCNTLP